MQEVDKIMILYHGTNMYFDKIDLSKCMPYKDFGQGFYLTNIREQAYDMAKRKSRRFGNPIIHTYQIDDMILQGEGDCKVLKFEEPNEEWAEFILSNREQTNPPFEHSYDIVIGPVADDGVAYILNRYLEGSFSMEDVVKGLRYSKLNNQIFFGTYKAIKHFIE